MKNFLEPDITWEVFGVKRQEDFIKRFISPGKFHENVPVEITSDYEIVERLQFYSYYKFALIDEAFSRATKIFEASVNLRIRNLGLEKKNGFEGLNAKIRKLQNYSSPELYKQWSHVRELRNIFAHHEADRMFGSTLLKSFIYLINMINSVFLDHKEISEREENLKRLQLETEPFEKGLFILKFKGNDSLVWSCIPYATSVNPKHNPSLWCFHPVYKTTEIKELHDFAPPFILTLKNIVISNNTFQAKIVDDSGEIQVFPTDKIENKVKYEIYNQTMFKAEASLKGDYWHVLEQKISNEISKFIYNEWDKP